MSKLSKELDKIDKAIEKLKKQNGYFIMDSYARQVYDQALVDLRNMWVDLRNMWKEKL